MRPVVLVHGVWDSARRMAPLTRGLAQRGLAPLCAIDLTPPWGHALLEKLAEQLAQYVEQTQRIYGSAQVDIVGFSMGALVSRAYLALLGGGKHVRTFVSISAPHRGTRMAHLLPLAGIKQMRPHSALFAQLGQDCSAFPSVSVHCLYTPYDATIVPGSSGVLPGARSVHVVPALFHRWMLSDARVHDLVASLLRAEA